MTLFILQAFLNYMTEKDRLTKIDKAITGAITAC
jgi:hypothetical protein